MVQQDIKDAETRPKAEILKEQMDGLKTAGRTVRDVAIESIPGVSEALAEKRVDEALQRGDTTGAMIEGAAGLMGAVPMVGDVAAKGLRAVTKSLRKQDINEAEKLVDNTDKLQEWRDANKLPESQRQKNIPEAQQAAEDLFQGNVTSKEARNRIKDVFPEPKLYTAETMPEMPTVTDVVGSMGKKAEKGILGIKGFDLAPGQRVGARLDIPAYNEYDKWVVSIHDGKSRNGSVVGYGQAIRLKNIEFGSDPKVALDIAKGKRVAKTTGEEKPMGKATIARVFGDYVPEDPYELQEFARKALADKDSGWTQVGMNPYRGSYFYDKATGTPVTRADEVIQVGPLVLAKNVTKPKMSELKEMFNTPAARTADGKLRVFNKGGVVPMNNMSKQMELFEPVERGFDEGGLMDEGGTVDPVSGNDVPPGSTQEEVRDDIPAQLSEGEFVFPADVVRYIGLENLMRMRQEAKQGLAQMDAMGQMGNSEEATVEDNLPFDMYDLDVEEDRNFNVGGYVAPTVPTNPYSQPGQVNPQTGTYTLPGTGIAGYQVPTGGQTGYTPYGGAAPYFQPVQFTGPQFQTALQTTNLPTFADTVGSNIGKYDELRTYINDAGQILQIPFKDGKPIYPIPEGYRPKGDQPTAEQPTTTPVTTPITNQGQDDGGGDGPGSGLGVTSSTSKGFGNIGVTQSSAYNSATTTLGAFQLSSLSPTMALGAKVFDFTSPNTKATMGNLARETAVNTLGLTSVDQATTAQLDAIGHAMSASMNLASNVKGSTPAAVAKSAATISGSLIGAYKDGTLSLDQMENIANVELDSVTGAWKDKEAVKDYVDAILSQELKDIELGLIGTSKEKGITNAEKAARQSAEIEAAIDAGTYGLSKDDPDDTGAAPGSGGTPSGPPGSGAPGTGAPGTGGLGPGGGGGTVSSGGTVGSGRDSSTGVGMNEGQGDAGPGSSGPGNAGSGSSCFAAGTKFFMEDGSLKNIEDIKIGDVLQQGGKVRTTIVGDGLYENWYMYGNTKVTGTHSVFENDTWKRVANSDRAIPTNKDEFIYTLVNEKHRLIAEDGVMYGDYDEVDNLDIEDGLLEIMNLQDAVEEAA